MLMLKGSFTHKYGNFLAILKEGPDKKDGQNEFQEEISMYGFIDAEPLFPTEFSISRYMFKFLSLQRITKK